jgi:hypothetical protein
MARETAARLWCGSPLPLSVMPQDHSLREAAATQSGTGVPHSKTLARMPMARAKSARWWSAGLFSSRKFHWRRPVAPTAGDIFHPHAGAVAVAGFDQSGRDGDLGRGCLQVAAFPDGRDLLEARRARRGWKRLNRRDLGHAPFHGGKRGRALVRRGAETVTPVTVGWTWTVRRTGSPERGWRGACPAETSQPASSAAGAGGVAARATTPEAQHHPAAQSKTRVTPSGSHNTTLLASGAIGKEEAFRHNSTSAVE